MKQNHSAEYYIDFNYHQTPHSKPTTATNLLTSFWHCRRLRCGFSLNQIQIENFKTKSYWAFLPFFILIMKCNTKNIMGLWVSELNCWASQSQESEKALRRTCTIWRIYTSAIFFYEMLIFFSSMLVLQVPSLSPRQGQSEVTPPALMAQYHQHMHLGWMFRT